MAIRKLKNGTISISGKDAIEYIDKWREERVMLWNNTNLLDNKEEKKFTKQQMLSFAERCMLNLLSTKPDGSDYSDISSLDVRRIKKVLNDFGGDDSIKNFIFPNIANDKELFNKINKNNDSSKFIKINFDGDIDEQMVKIKND